MENKPQVLRLVPPNLQSSNMLGVQIGVRPYRKGGICLDTTKIDNTIVYHNYGHGGSGISVGPGCVKYCVDNFLKNHAEGPKVNRITVLGSGIMGLMTGIMMVDMGYQVTIIAENFPREEAKGGLKSPTDKPFITSQVAAGLWLPVGIEVKNTELHKQISRYSFDYYADCIAKKKYACLSYKPFITIDESIKGYLKIARDDGLFEDLIRTKITFNGIDMQDVFVCKTILMEADKLCIELMQEAIKKGIKFEQRKLSNHQELKDFLMKNQIKTLFNCSGFASSYLFNDNNVIGVRGHLVYFKKPPGLEYLLFGDFRENLYQVQIFAHSDKVILGGTYEEGVDELKVDYEKIERIRKNAEAYISNNMRVEIVMHDDEVWKIKEDNQ